jgi:UTP--glucose-1-phosphate uridylyltransferase
MLTVVDRPVIQYVVDEAREAGIEVFVFVTGRNKGLIEDHFDLQPELEGTLRERGRQAALDGLAAGLPAAGAFAFTRQQAPLGLGHAIWCARELVGREPFAVLLPDMVMAGARSCLAQMIEVYQQTGGNVVAVGECDPAQTASYGIVGVGEQAPGHFRITAMVEKPKPAEAPSNLYINGRYIFQPELFDHLARFEKGAGGEIQVTDAMKRLAETQPFYGVRFDGRTFDCGSKAGFLAANIAFGLARPELRAELRAELDAALAAEPG